MTTTADAGPVRRFSFDPSSPAQRRATALAMADQAYKRDLVRLRKQLGLSQEEVARRMGVSQPTVASFERYENDPKLSTLRRYAHAVGLLVEHNVEIDRGAVERPWSPARHLDVEITPTPVRARRPVPVRDDYLAYGLAV